LGDRLKERPSELLTINKTRRKTKEADQGKQKGAFHANHPARVKARRAKRDSKGKQSMTANSSKNLKSIAFRSRG
jgi:hypothetical protein